MHKNIYDKETKNIYLPVTEIGNWKEVISTRKRAFSLSNFKFEPYLHNKQFFKKKHHHTGTPWPCNNKPVYSLKRNKKYIQFVQEYS